MSTLRWLPVWLLLGACAQTPRIAPATTSVAPARAAITVYLPPPMTPDGLTVELDDGAKQWRWTGDTLAPTAGGQWRSPVVDTRGAGELRMRYTWRDAAGRTGSEGEVGVPMKADWLWGFDLHVADTDPRAACFGCTGSRRFELAPSLRRAPGQAVFVTWGGNSIRQPAIY